MTLHSTIQPDDDFLLDDGLPCLRRDGKLYYLGDMQPRVLEACRRVEISFEQLTEKLGTNRPALVLILKGYDAVPLPLKSMIDRLVSQTGLMQPAMTYCAMPETESAADSPADSRAPLSTTIHAVPIPDEENARAATPLSGSDRPPITVPVEPVPEEVMIPDVVSLDRPGAPHVVVPASVPDFAPGATGFTPGLRRAPKAHGRKGSATKQRQFLLT